MKNYIEIKTSEVILTYHISNCQICIKCCRSFYLFLWKNGFGSKI